MSSNAGGAETETEDKSLSDEEEQTRIGGGLTASVKHSMIGLSKTLALVYFVLDPHSLSPCLYLVSDNHERERPRLAAPRPIAMRR